MKAISIQEAQQTLIELLRRLRPGETVQLVEEDQPVAELTSLRRVDEKAKPRRLGTQAGSVLYMAPDFDAPLEDFREYMQ